MGSPYMVSFHDYLEKSLFRPYLNRGCSLTSETMVPKPRFTLAAISLNCESAQVETCGALKF